MKVIIITLFSFLTLAIGLGTINIWGKNQAFQEFRHPFFEMALGLDSVKASTPQDVDAINTANPSLIIWIQVRVTKDHDFVVLQKPVEKSYRYSIAELDQLGTSPISLTEFILRAPKSRFIFHFPDNATDLHTDILNFIKKHELANQVLISSDVDAVIKAVRDEAPGWIFGTSQSDLLRLLSYEAMWILPAANFKSDVLIAPLQIKGRPAFTQAGLDEIKRRKKRSLLGLLTTKDDVARAKSFSPDGLLFETIDLWSQTRP